LISAKKCVITYLFNGLVLLILLFGVLMVPFFSVEVGECWLVRDVLEYS